MNTAESYAQLAPLLKKALDDSNEFTLAILGENGELKHSTKESSRKMLKHGAILYNYPNCHQKSKSELL